MYLALVQIIDRMGKLLAILWEKHSVFPSNTLWKSVAQVRRGTTNSSE